MSKLSFRRWALIATAMQTMRQSVQFGLRGLAAAAAVIKTTASDSIRLLSPLSPRHCERSEAIQNPSAERF
ncbi:MULTISPECIES: hypothetical protein [unclassified Bradyrhizobium]|uniref:hypothetical protein n=1 Tax=unclassified Bradyrhizobium TaxID=2631580 RepID=UPI001CD41EE3|nr:MULTISPECIES: hypothetical protein [unclassified Bradyrhizobium]MCA1378493.1 hypothetical protein [Bradyrhizobium sp. IC4060]MCA1489173.1 hypothetical protein [Bradyrhizobium sp. IC4061]MCA1545059.1 hypothetical protein [Bradyrhizobium sp. NBAIM32]